jgi:hypothetical protein
MNLAQLVAERAEADVWPTVTPRTGPAIQLVARRRDPAVLASMATHRAPTTHARHAGTRRRFTAAVRHQRTRTGRANAPRRAQRAAPPASVRDVATHHVSRAALRNPAPVPFGNRTDTPRFGYRMARDKTVCRPFRRPRAPVPSASGSGGDVEREPCLEHDGGSGGVAGVAWAVVTAVRIPNGHAGTGRPAFESPALRTGRRPERPGRVLDVPPGGRSAAGAVSATSAAANQAPSSRKKPGAAGT